MELLDKVRSNTDNVVKYVFRVHPGTNSIVEFSYIDNGTGKDIICVSCQTMCGMGCKFCHCTDHVDKIPTKSLTWEKIVNGVEYIVNDLKEYKDTLLVSYMGCGEPFNSAWEDDIFTSMQALYQGYNGRDYKTVRFAMATMLPANKMVRFFRFCENIKRKNIPLKLHLSLHYTDDETRKEWMPNALDINSSIAACKFYKEYTGNAVEIHYTLIDGVNDKVSNLAKLNLLLENSGFNLKFIEYNEKESIGYKPSKKVQLFKKFVVSVPTEIYLPPGRDIGSSCGQFSFEQYEKYKIEEN